MQLDLSGILISEAVKSHISPAPQSRLQNFMYTIAYKTKKQGIIWYLFFKHFKHSNFCDLTTSQRKSDFVTKNLCTLELSLSIYRLQTGLKSDVFLLCFRLVCKFYFGNVLHTFLDPWCSGGAKTRSPDGGGDVFCCLSCPLHPILCKSPNAKQCSVIWFVCRASGYCLEVCL